LALIEQARVACGTLCVGVKLLTPVNTNLNLIAYSLSKHYWGRRPASANVGQSRIMAIPDYQSLMLPGIRRSSFEWPHANGHGLLRPSGARFTDLRRSPLPTRAEDLKRRFSGPLILIGGGVRTPKERLRCPLRHLVNSQLATSQLARQEGWRFRLA
jgi:hypothetical protein